MTPLQEQAVVVLWASGQFDTADIAELVLASEADVHRLTRCARDVARELGMTVEELATA